MSQLSMFTQEATTILPIPQEAAPPPPPRTRPVDTRLVERFRVWADALQPKIEHAGRPMTQNPTPKRNREYQSRMIDCRNLERLQKALRALADAHEGGSIALSLAGLREKEAIRLMVHKYVDGSKGGYYSAIEADDFRDTTPAARLLQEMIDWPAAQRSERERLRKIGEMEAAIKLINIDGYFPTPPAVVAMMLERAAIAPNSRVLEPSAGNGNIADAIRKDCLSVSIDTIEIVPRLRDILALKNYRVLTDDFLAWENPQGYLYDRIVMNPPFERQADIDHIRKAFSLLAEGGTLVSILSPSFEFRQDRKATEFRAWLESLGAVWEPLPEESFKSSGTGVATRLLVMDAGREAREKAPRP